MEKPVRLAVALKYEEEGPATPIVIAAGRGEIAEKIVQIARREKVPLHQDESLVQVLAELEIGTQIPPELYQAVAQIIAFVWRIDKKYG